MHCQYGLPGCRVRGRHVQQAIKSPRPKQSSVYTVWPVGRRYHNNPSPCLQTQRGESELAFALFFVWRHHSLVVKHDPAIQLLPCTGSLGIEFLVEDLQGRCWGEAREMHCI